MKLWFVQFGQAVALILVLAALVIGTSIETGRTVNQHVDNTIAQTIIDAQNKSRNQSQQFQQLVQQVNTICKTLEAQNSEIHC